MNKIRNKIVGNIVISTLVLSMSTFLNFPIFPVKATTILESFKINYEAKYEIGEGRG